MSLLVLLLRRNAAVLGIAPAVPPGAARAPDQGDARGRADESRQGPSSDAASPDDAGPESPA